MYFFTIELCPYITLIGLVQEKHNLECNIKKPLALVYNVDILKKTEQNWSINGSKIVRRQPGYLFSIETEGMHRRSSFVSTLLY